MIITDCFYVLGAQLAPGVSGLHIQLTMLEIYEPLMGAGHPGGSSSHALVGAGPPHQQQQQGQHASPRQHSGFAFFGRSHP